MAYSETLANKVRAILSEKRKITEKKMFGGVSFLLNGNMCCGVHGDELILRFDPKRHEEFLAMKDIRDFDLSKMKSIRGWGLVKPNGLKTKSQVKRWINIGIDFSSSLKSKKK